MTSTTFASRPRAAARPRAPALPRPELALLLSVAGALNLWAPARNGWANEYYAGAVRAMSQSWHAFLYGSLDAQGVMTVDKPPLALWVQACPCARSASTRWPCSCPRRHGRQRRAVRRRHRGVPAAE